MLARLFDKKSSEPRKAGGLAMPPIDPDTVRTFAALLSLVLVFGGYHLLPGLKVFGLDEVNVYRDFTFKLVAEGRWINYLLHDALRGIPLAAGSLGFVILAWLFFYLLARGFTVDNRYAAVVASTLILAPPFVEQSLWPLTHLPSVVTLLFLVWLARNGVADWLVYIVSGVLLFGMMQNYYFLTPLLLVNRIDVRQRPLGGVARQLARHLALWILGAFLGVIAALVMVFLITGQAGLVPAEWRQATPIASIPDLVRNLLKVARYLHDRVATILQSGTDASLLFLSLWVVLVAVRARFWRAELVRVVMLVTVGLSFFAFSVPLAPIIAMRSLVALSTAIVILLLVPHKQVGTAYWMSLFLFLWVGFNLSVESAAYFRKHQTETEYVLQNIVAELPKHPSNYRALAVFGKVDASAREAIWFNRGPWARSIALAAGFPRFWECRRNIPKACSDLERKLDISSRVSSQKVQFIGAVDNIAVILFATPPAGSALPVPYQR